MISNDLFTELCHIADIRAAVVGFYRKRRTTMNRTMPNALFQEEPILGIFESNAIPYCYCVES
jgi:hypothetical protein